VNIRTPRIGSVCSADPNDWPAVAHDFAYELRQFIKTDRDPDRRRAAMSAISEFEDAGDDPEALQAFVEGSGKDALQAYCLPFMSFSSAPSGDYGFWPDIEGLEYSARSKDGVIKVNAGDAWPPLWTSSGHRSAVHHGNQRPRQRDPLQPPPPGSLELRLTTSSATGRSATGGRTLNCASPWAYTNTLAGAGHCDRLPSAGGLRVPGTRGR
jgi:hypothetical protein